MPDVCPGIRCTIVWYRIAHAEDLEQVGRRRLGTVGERQSERPGWRAPKRDRRGSGKHARARRRGGVAFGRNRRSGARAAAASRSRARRRRPFRARRAHRDGRRLALSLDWKSLPSRFGPSLHRDRPRGRGSARGARAPRRDRAGRCSPRCGRSRRHRRGLRVSRHHRKLFGWTLAEHATSLRAQRLRRHRRRRRPSRAAHFARHRALHARRQSSPHPERQGVQGRAGQLHEQSVAPVQLRRRGRCKRGSGPRTGAWSPDPCPHGCGHQRAASFCAHSRAWCFECPDPFPRLGRSDEHGLLQGEERRHSTGEVHLRCGERRNARADLSRLCSRDDAEPISRGRSPGCESSSRR